MKVNVNSETGLLKTVILGIASDRGNVKHLNNPKYAEIVKNGEDPTENELVEEVEGFRKVLLENDVEVLKPNNIPNQGQIFCRDIGFAIGDDFFLARMQKENRQNEVEAIREIANQFEKVHCPPENAIIEGGDVIVLKDSVFIGLGGRTNELGLSFVKEIVGNKKEVISFSLNVTEESKTNILHLDCAFQPIGLKYGIMYKEGFKNIPSAIYDIFGEDNLIFVTQQEMYDMFPNIFSINPEKVVIGKSFRRLSKELKKRNIEPIEVEYGKVSKLGGLLRCSTLPINRD
jgi:N-dimethylarginine dimethylaminohydrolase